MEKIKRILWNEAGGSVSVEEGSTGNLFTLWNKEVIEAKVLVESKCFITIFCHNKISQEDLILTNVYAPTIVQV